MHTCTCTCTCTHAHAHAHAQVRAEQLEVAARALEAYERAMLVGDFNFDDKQTWGDWRLAGGHVLAGRRREGAQLENTVLGRLLPRFVDVWPALHGHEGVTYDGAANPHVADRHERMRYDRILCSGALELS